MPTLQSLPALPALDLDWSWWCKKHKAVLDNMPGEGRKERSIAAFIILLQTLMASPQFELECLGNTNNIRAVCAAHAPLCCYIGEPALRRLFRKVGAINANT